MVKVIYNDQLLYNVVIWELFGSSLWTEKVALNICLLIYDLQSKDWINTYKKCTLTL